MTPTVNDISEWEYNVLRAVQEIADSPQAKIDILLETRQGWLTNVHVRDLLEAPSVKTRTTLRTLAAQGLLTERMFMSSRHFRLTQKGLDRLSKPAPSSNDGSVDSQSWTGVIETFQTKRALAILSEMEDVCEQMRNNNDRAQILGLVRALEILLNLPDPPRAGVVSLARDPAFANVIQVGAFLAALVAAVKA